MGMIIFILAHSRMKPKKQEVAPFRGITMVHLQPNPLFFVFCYFWVWLSLSWKPLLYNLLKRKSGGIGHKRLRQSGEEMGVWDGEAGSNVLSEKVQERTF